MNLNGQDVINRFYGEFSIAEIQQKCPGVGIDTIRRTLKSFRAKGVIECLSRGRNAKWNKTGK